MNGFPHRRVGVNFMPLFRPFRAGDICDHWTQGVALGYHIWPRWGLARSGWCIACRTVGAVIVRVVGAMPCVPLGRWLVCSVGTMPVRSVGTMARAFRRDDARAFRCGDDSCIP